MKRGCTWWGVVMSMSITSAGQLQAASTPVNRSLTGLKAVRIKEQLYTLAAQQLSKDGFTAVGPQDAAKVPVVYIRLSSVLGGAKDMPVSFYLTVQVKQLAVLAQGTSSTCQAATTPETPPLLVTTWEKGSMAMVNRAELFFYIQHILINVLGDLATDQKQANEMTQAR